MATPTRKKGFDGAASAAPARLFDREPPHNVEAERSVLGAILINPQVVGQAVEILGEGSADTFYIPAHQNIYDAAVALFRRSTPADLVTVTEELTRRGQLEGAGGVTAVADLTGAAPTSANIEHYARIVLDAALTRRLIATCAVVTAQAYDGGMAVEELLEDAEKQVFQLSEHRHTNPIYSAADLVTESMKQLEARIRNKDSITGLPTGFHTLDKLLSGLQPSDMIVLAARPSVGKTAFSLNIAAHVAIEQKKGVLLFTLEMSKEQFMYRLLCLVGQVDMNRVRDGYLAEAEVPKAQRAAGQLMNASIYMDESVGLTPLEMRSRARRHAAQHPDLGLVIIDYMQLMHISGRSENRQTEISEISRAIKGLARELRVPVMALSQLSREAEKNDTGSPQLSHLRESGSIEQDADVVMMLSRPPAKDREEKKDVIVLDIAKQRNGPTGRVELLFRKNMQRFMSIDDHGSPGGPPPGADFGPTDLEGGGYHEDDVPFD